MRTRFSIVMSTYNHEFSLKERVSSILAQLGPNDELIVVDDASPDNSAAILKTFLAKDSRLKMIQNIKNQGVIKSVNHAIKQAEGKFIMAVATDDFFLPGFVDQTLNALARIGDKAKIAFSDPALFFEATGKTVVNHLNLSTSPTYFSPTELIVT